MASGTVTAGYTGIPSVLYNPSVRPNLIKRYRDDDYTVLMDAMKAWYKGEDFQYYTAYESPMFVPVDTTGATSVATSGTAVITINGLTTGNSGVLIKSKLVRWIHSGTLYNARIRSVTTAAGRDTVILDSSVAGAPNLVLTAGDILYQYSNAQEEGSDAPPAERWSMTTLYNLTQIFRETGEITDVARARFAATNTFKLDIGDGKIGKGRWDDVRNFMKHRAEIGFALLLGELSDANFTATSPTVTGANGNGVQTTKGLIPHIRDYGWTNNLASLGTLTSTDLENIGAKITAARGAMKYRLIGANQPMSRLSSHLVGIVGSFTSLRLEVEGKKVDLTTQGFKFGNIDYEMTPINTFDNQQVIPTGDDIAKSVYFIPDGKAAAYRGTKSVTQNYISVQYMPVIEAGDGNEKTAEVHVGALLERPNSGKAVDTCTYETMAGADIIHPYIMGTAKVLS